ncbi:MAG TPA: hypothetical protein VM891_14490 [Amaricoccus sp.]|nr:hypothetical protein [Amaricoccus sp.]
MVTPFREYPLLNTPSMVVIILREAAADAPATVAGCAAALRRLLDRAGEHPPFGPEEVARRLEMLVRYLAEAKLVVVAPDGSFGASARGRAALAEHPQGFDVADLMAYPEFARHVRGIELRRAALDPRATGYDQGFYAYWVGEGPADNPYAPDSADHLAWENGWSEALDEDFRWTGPRAAENLR